MSETAELRVGDKTLELNVIEGSEGEKAIDITRLRAQTGYITLDPGYANSGSCQSACLPWRSTRNVPPGTIGYPSNPYGLVIFTRKNYSK